jgi:Male sterility protein
MRDCELINLKNFNDKIENFLYKSMVKVQDRIEKGMDVLGYYANNQWNFDNEVQCIFRERLNDLEEDRYKVNSRGVDIRDYFYQAGLGVRRYILKTPDEMLPAALKENRK